MKNRLEIAKTLLADDGTIAISIDNYEVAYTLILLDEIFGRNNRKNIITVKRASASGAKVINLGVVNVVEYIVIYSKTDNWKPNRIFMSKEYDTRYNKFIKNRNEHYENWEFITVLEAFAEYSNLPKSKLKKHYGENYQIELEKFILSHSNSICRFAALDEKQISNDTMHAKQLSKNNPTKIIHQQRDGFKDYYLIDGEAILFIKDRLSIIDGYETFGTPMTNFWDDCLPNDLHNEGQVEFKKGKKPEKLIKRIIELTTNENDIILDYHLGSGTTAAVAHKMNRQYIGIEQMDYIETLAVERLKKVIDGEQGGISKAINWQGGGEFVYAELAPFNETAKQQILACENSDGIKTLFEDLCERYFLKYNVSVDEFSQIINEPEFQSLPLDKQKQMVLEMLDLNQMYVSLSEMNDEQFAGCLNDNDKALSRAFYQSVKNQAEKKDGE